MQNDPYQTGLYYIEGNGRFHTVELSGGQILSGSTPEAQALGREGRPFSDIREELLSQGYIVEKIY